MIRRSLIHILLLGHVAEAFSEFFTPSLPYVTVLHASPLKYSALPQGISPFEKSIAKGMDIQENFRKLAAPAVERAIRDGVTQIELDFPCFVGGDQSKTQFDDLDNLQELDANRDWCVQLLPTISNKKRDVWFILPDDKECELAAKEWTGQRFRQAAKFTSIRAAIMATAGEDQYSKAWGSSIASVVSKLSGGDGILADSSTLDELTDDDEDDSDSKTRLHLVCQPGSGGPVEDWINVERIHKASPPGQLTCVVNGALDKVRDGYYAAVFFPALASTVPFYKQFEAVFVLRPLSAKGLYGWLFRVYPEPWQVVLQMARPTKKGDQTVVTVENMVALVSQDRPSYQESVDAMLATAAKKQ
jgi:hypothetical protein